MNYSEGKLNIFSYRYIKIDFNIIFIFTLKNMRLTKYIIIFHLIFNFPHLCIIDWNCIATVLAWTY